MNERKSAKGCPWSDLEPGGETLTVHDFLTTRLSALMSALRRQVTIPYAKAFGLSIVEWRVLSLVAHARILPFGELVTQSSSDKAIISRVVRQLEQRGLILTRPETESAKKKIACAITDAGMAIYDQAIKVARRRQADVILMLSSEEREALFSIIDKLRDGLDD